MNIQRMSSRARLSVGTLVVAATLSACASAPIPDHKRGEIDLLGTANGFEASDPDLAMSQAYADDQPTLVTRVGESQSGLAIS